MKKPTAPKFSTGEYVSLNTANGNVVLLQVIGGPQFDAMANGITYTYYPCRVIHSPVSDFVTGATVTVLEGRLVTASLSKGAK